MSIVKVSESFSCSKKLFNYSQLVGISVNSVYVLVVFENKTQSLLIMKEVGGDITGANAMYTHSSVQTFLMNVKKHEMS